MRPRAVSLKSSLPKRCLAEIIGTFGLVFATAGAAVVDELSGGRITHLGVGVVSGLIITVMIYAVGHVSGAHFNPAVTLGFAVGRHFPVKELPVYWAAQLLGAGVGALSLRALFGKVGILGGTVPRGSTLESFSFEIPLTFILMFVIMAVATDTRAKGDHAALAIGAAVGLNSIFGGPISGASMNPARSFGPALASWTWTDHWIYWTAPFIGAAIATLAYNLLKGDGDKGDLPPDSPAQG